MDAAELARIVATLERAIAEARAMAKMETDGGEEFDQVVRHVREMHAILLEGLAANPALATERMRGLMDATGNAADELDVAAARLVGNLH